MIRGGSQSRSRKDGVEHRHRISVAHVRDRVRLHVVVESLQGVGEIVAGLVDEDVGHEVHLVPPRRGTERLRVFLTARRALGDHRDPLKPLTPEPTRAHGAFLGHAAVARREAVVAVVGLGAVGRDQWHLPTFHGGQQGQRVVGDVRAQDGETPGVAQCLVPGDRGCRVLPRQAPRHHRDDLDRPLQFAVVERVFRCEHDGIETVPEQLPGVDVDEVADLHRRVLLEAMTDLRDLRRIDHERVRGDLLVGRSCPSRATGSASRVARASRCRTRPPWPARRTSAASVRVPRRPSAVVWCSRPCSLPRRVHRARAIHRVLRSPMRPVARLSSRCRRSSCAGTRPRPRDCPDARIRSASHHRTATPATTDPVRCC